MNAAVPDDALDRRALKSVAVQFFANGATYATIIPRLPEIREQVDISISTLGLVLTVGSIASLIGSVFAGRVTAHIGSRRVMIFGGVMSVAFLPIIGFATSPIVLALALFGLLFFDIFIDVAMNVQGSALSARRHTPVMNRLHGLWSLGTVAGGLLTVILLRNDVSTEVQLTAVAIVLIGADVHSSAGSNTSLPSRSPISTSQFRRSTESLVPRGLVPHSSPGSPVKAPMTSCTSVPQTMSNPSSPLKSMLVTS